MCWYEVKIVTNLSEKLLEWCWVLGVGFYAKG